MGPRAFLQATGKAVRNIDRKHLLAFAGSLAYYYFLSLIPFLILLASGLAYIPIPHLFDQVLLWMSYFLPPDSMALVRKVFADLMATRNSGFLSFGIIGTIWTASGASAAMIEALNVAYEVKEGRAFWHTRLLAIGLTFIVAALGANCAGRYDSGTRVRRAVSASRRPGSAVSGNLVILPVDPGDMYLDPGCRSDLPSGAQR